MEYIRQIHFYPDCRNHPLHKWSLRIRLRHKHRIRLQNHLHHKHLHTRLLNHMHHNHLLHMLLQMHLHHLHYQNLLRRKFQNHLHLIVFSYQNEILFYTSFLFCLLPVPALLPHQYRTHRKAHLTLRYGYAVWFQE